MCLSVESKVLGHTFSKASGGGHTPRIQTTKFRHFPVRRCEAWARSSSMVSYHVEGKVRKEDRVRIRKGKGVGEERSIR